MDQEYYKEVRYDLYCRTCEHLELDDEEDPCRECLDIPVNYGTSRPTMYKEKE